MSREPVHSERKLEDQVGPIGESVSRVVIHRAVRIDWRFWGVVVALTALPLTWPLRTGDIIGAAVGLGLAVLTILVGAKVTHIDVVTS